jgi:hypothetical protein
MRKARGKTENLTPNSGFREKQWASYSQVCENGAIGLFLAVEKREF